MDVDIKQQRIKRSKRRERAQRMHAKKHELDSGEEDELSAKEKVQRPPPPSRRKKKETSLFDEDVVDGFAILSFKSYEDLENCVQQCLVKSAVTLGLDPASQSFLHRNHHKHHRNHVHNHNNNNHHHDSNSSTPVTPVKTDYNLPSPPTTPNNFNHNKNPSSVDLKHDSEGGENDASVVQSFKRPSGTKVSTSSPSQSGQRRSSSRERFSDASSNCSSGRGYICDSEDDGDKGSDNSDLFRTSLVSRKDELPGRVSSEPTQNLPTTAANDPISITPPSRQPTPPLVNGVEFDDHSIPETTIASTTHIRPSQNPMLPPPSTTPRALQVSQPTCPSPTIPPASTPPITSKPQNSHVNGLEPSTPPASVTSRYSPVPSSGLNSPRHFSTNTLPPTSVPPYQTPPQACPLSLSITNSYITSSTSQHPILSHAASNYIPKSSNQQMPSPHQHSSPYMQKPNIMYHPPHGAPYPSPSFHPSPYKSTPSLLATVSSSYIPYSTPPSSTVTVSASATIPSTSSSQLTAATIATNFNSPYQPPVHPQHYPPLYAPYRNTPYMPSTLSNAARLNRSSPISVISTKSSAASTPTLVAPITAAAAATTTTTTTTTSLLSGHPVLGRGQSPRGPSPSRERDGYSLNRNTGSTLNSASPFNTPSLALPPATGPTLTPTIPSSAPSSLVYNKPALWGPIGNNSIATSTMASISRQHSSYPPPLFSSPVSTATSQPSSLPTAPPAHNPFSAESLFQSNQADMLRRELDSRFLASSQERALTVGAPYLRTEMHHHQHQHTHVHQHTATPLIPAVAATVTSIPSASTLPSTPSSALYAPPLFKDIPKLGGVDSPFYRQNLLSGSYPGFTPGLLHSSIGHTPFTPPNHMPTFTPKQLTDTSKPTKSSKPGKWNAMHVRLAWEIYHYQQKQQVAETKNVASNPVPKTELLRPPTHLFPPSRPPHDLSPFTSPHHHHPGLPPGYPPLGPAAMFSRYPTGFPPISSFPPNPMNDPWARLQPSRGLPTPNSAYGPPGAWPIKPDPVETERAEQQQRERERERERERDREREREKERERGRERERVKREEKRRQMIQQQQQQQQQLQHQQQQQQQQHQQHLQHQHHQQQQHLHQQQQLQQQVAKMRERSPLKDPNLMPKEEDLNNMMLGRVPPTSHYLPPPPRHPQRALPTHFSPWDQYRYDSLRFSPLIAAAAYRAEEEEHRAKLFGYHPQSHLRPKDPSPNTHRQMPPDMQLPKKDESSQSR